MADNIDVTPGTGATVAADLVSGALHQRVKISQGADGSATDVSSSAPLEVSLANHGSNSTAVKVDGSAVTQPVSDASGSLTVDYATTGSGTATGALRVELPTNGTGVIATVGTITNAVTVNSHAVTNAGTFAVQEADGANTTLGSKADAKSTATDTTAITAMSVLKQISASVQAPPSQAVTNAGTFAAQAAITAASGSISSGALSSGSVASGAFASGAVGSGAVASGAFASGALASGSVASGAIASGAIAAGAIAAGASSIADNEDVGMADADRGVKMLITRRDTPANTSGTTGDYEFPQMSGGYLWVHDNKGLANLAFSAAFTTLTRPANTTGYAAADSISDNATAGSVTALTGTFSDINDDPIFISEILIASTDTGLAGKRIRAYLFNADPTASSGVGGGDNAAFSQKKAGYIGSCSGVLETGFSDGTVGRLVPAFNDTTTAPGQAAPAGGFIVAKPTSGAKTLFIQYQTLDAFTPSANSTTIIGTARGWQARAV